MAKFDQRPLHVVKDAPPRPPSWASDLRYRTLVDHLPHTSVVVYDHDLRFQLAAGPALEATGWVAEDVEGRLLTDLVPEPQCSALARHYRAALTGEPRSVEYRSSVDGRAFWLQLVPLRDEQGNVETAMAVSLDITERADALVGLAAAETRFRRAFDEAPIGMALLSPEGAFRQVNEMLCSISGFSREELLDGTLVSFAHPTSRPGCRRTLDRMAESIQPAHAGELRCLDAAGEVVHISLHLSAMCDENGRVTDLLAHMLDVTDQKRFERRLEHIAEHDLLTGLPNRQAVEGEIERHLANVKRYGDESALLIVDIDGFKYFNDSLGHRTGDELIAHVSRLLKRRLRETDVIARVGGDEWAILFPRASAAQAREVAELLLQTLRTETGMLPSGRMHAPVAASIGIAMFGPMDTLDGNAMMRAELAMFDAKESGGGSLAFYSSERRSEPPIKTRLVWADRIRSALREDRLVLHAQPIVSLIDGSVAIHELLLRMVGDGGEVIAPASFLSIAEQLDLIQELDRWVLRRAIRLAAGSRLTGDFAVNISARSIADPRLPDLVEQQLSEYGVEPSRLIVEVTETAAIGDFDLAQGLAHRLSGLGCRLALDDFGAGFGTFHYVKHLPFDLLKIDGGLIADCLASTADRLIVEAAVGIAKGMDKLTIAEHAPNRATLDFLRDCGVDYSQSFITGPPRPTIAPSDQQGARP